MEVSFHALASTFFSTAPSWKTRDGEFSVRASMLEIYNETIRDLLVLAAKAGREKHEIHHIRKPKQTEDGGSGAFVWETQVTGSYESAVDSADEARFAFCRQRLRSGLRAPRDATPHLQEATPSLP